VSASVEVSAGGINIYFGGVFVAYIGEEDGAVQLEHDFVVATVTSQTIRIVSQGIPDAIVDSLTITRFA
jgi:hypothetical protein